MSYKDFTFNALEEKFSIRQSTRRLFADDVPRVQASEWLQQTLAIARRMPLRSEKAKSELLIAPIVTEIKLQNEDTIQVFSGEMLIADKSKKLNGEIDFIFVRHPRAVELRSPIFCVTEAKRGALEEGWTQCAAQMYGAYIFNQKHNTPVTTIYGAVSNGADWQFLQLENDTIYIDEHTYSIEQISLLLGVLQYIITKT